MCILKRMSRSSPRTHHPHIACLSSLLCICTAHCCMSALKRMSRSLGCLRIHHLMFRTARLNQSMFGQYRLQRTARLHCTPALMGMFRSSGCLRIHCSMFRMIFQAVRMF